LHLIAAGSLLEFALEEIPRRKAIWTQPLVLKAGDKLALTAEF